MAHVGSQLTFAVLFTDSDGDAADPDEVVFTLKEGIDGTLLEWEYAASPTEGTHYPLGMSPLVRDAEGDYSVSFIARKPERHTGKFIGSGTVFQASEVTYFVRYSEVDL